MPHIELRSVVDGRSVCYAPHSHKQWSIGAITSGQSNFVTGTRHYQVSAGTLVLVNPDHVHACNPIAEQAWSYLMMYVECDWLAGLLHQLGLRENCNWHPTRTDLIHDTDLFEHYGRLAECLLARQTSVPVKQTAIVEFIAHLFSMLDASATTPPIEAAAPMPSRLQQLLADLDDESDQAWPLEAMCQRTGFTASQLIHAFKQHLGLTPHAYLINRRVQLAQTELKRGESIADAALNAGFADQPHLQRAFKRSLAATPGQYQRGSLKDQ